MYWKKTEHSISVQTPAKLNLYLEVLGKRSDGFHDLETVICAIDRFDHLMIEKSNEPGIVLTCDWSAETKRMQETSAEVTGDLPQGEQNLVFTAAKLFLERCRLQTGLCIDLTKSIPSQAGLGGASGNAAGTLVALNELFETGLSLDVLREWSAELGSDLPFFVAGHYAFCEGRGERVTLLNDIPIMNFVVVKPDFGLPTPLIFSELNLPAVKRSIDRNAVDKADFDWTSFLFNRLQEPAEKLAGTIRELCGELKSSGCKASMMTGSGSCCFGLCESPEQAEQIAQQFIRNRSGFVFTCRNLSNFSVRE